jgi:hypothetical protein
LISMWVLVGKQMNGESVVSWDSHARQGGKSGQLLSIRPVEGLVITCF